MDNYQEIQKKRNSRLVIALVMAGISVCLITQVMRIEVINKHRSSWIGWVRDFQEYSQANQFLSSKKVVTAGIEFRGLSEKNFRHHKGLSFYLAQNVMTDVVLKRECNDISLPCLVYCRDLAQADLSCPKGFQRQELISKHIAACF